MLESADIIAFELNGGSPAPSGGWESCDWEFADGNSLLTVKWSEATVNGAFLGEPVPRNPRVIANGSISGAAYGKYFGIPTSSIIRYQPDLAPESIVVSFLLIRVRDELNVLSPAFSLTIRGVVPHPGSEEATPDPDAFGVLLHESPARPARPVKPRKSAARKVQELCDSVGVKEAVLPAIATMWDRRIAGTPSRNAFEAAIYAVFNNLNDRQHAAMAHGFAGYRTFRQGGADTCFFHDRLANPIADRPLEPADFVEELIREGVAVAATQLFDYSDGTMGGGLARPWPNSLFSPPDPDGHPLPPVVGPWPWITAIRPVSNSDNEFGNTESFIAPTGVVWNPIDYQFASVCTITPHADGTFTSDCPRVKATGGGGLSFGGACEGGAAYNFGGECLRIPVQQAGGAIRLRGFNFITSPVTVTLKRRDDPHRPPVVQECVAFGDRKTPLLDGDGKVIADMNVRDYIDVPIPSEDPAHVGAPFPAGLYDISIDVNDDVTDPNHPVLRGSNSLVLRIDPNPNVRFHLRSDRGRCVTETSGPGDDEIWWDAIVGHFAPNATPIQDVYRREFPRSEWEGMEDGKVTTYACDIWGPAAFEREGVVCVAIIGLEVDSESAAREQLQGWLNAYIEGLKAIADAAFSLESSSVGLANLAVKAGVATARTAFTASLIAAGVIAGLTLISVGFWAAWAPAELVALDIFTLDAATAADHTDPQRALPAISVRQFSGYDTLVTTTQRALPKRGNPAELFVAWTQENEYATSESRYVLEFGLTQTIV
jgi:hypothetical protein